MWSVSNDKAPLKKKADKCVDVRVTTMDAELEFRLDYKSTGRDLFDLVCRMVGLREIWYFGLQFTTEKGYLDWLSFERKVLAQGVKKAENGYHFFFLVKYYPEDVSEELIQDVTQHYFYLQVKQSIVNMDIYCPPEASVLLASYAVQAKFGDFDEASYKPGMLQVDDLLPQRVIDQYQMTHEMWEDRIKTWWMNNKGMSREEAELEYLRIAQDLDMYGIHYFPIYNKKESDLWLGVTALGINLYDKNNKLSPRASFAWSEIRNLSFKDKKFIIQTSDKSSGSSMVAFWSQNAAVNKVILDLCIGGHNLYLRRRQPDSLEMQQMKSQAKEERLRKQNDRQKFEKEQQLCVQLEREKERLQQEVVQLQEQVFAAQEALRRSEETADLLAEKARMAEEESLLLAERASSAEAEIQKIRISALKTEEAKILMERKAREAELIASRMVEESEQRGKEANKLKQDLLKARQAEKTAKEKLFELMGNSYMPVYNSFDLSNSTSYCAAGSLSSGTGDYSRPYSFTADSLGERDLRSLSAEIEKERAEYMQKSKHLQEQLSELRTEIDGLKLEDRQTDMDRLYMESLTQGDNKFSTLRKSGAGSTKARVAIFDGIRMPAKRKPEKASPVETEKKRHSASSTEPTVALTTKDFFALEDTIADKTTADEDADTFQRTTESLLSLLVKYHETRKTKNAEDPISDGLQIQVMTSIMELRRLNRLSQFRNKKMRDRVTEERQKVEEQYLQLQNLLYEVSHIEKEVEKCLEFKSDHEDIEMIPVDQFYKEAPESISKPATTKHDAHNQRLARLTWELETRKKLEMELEKLEAEKAEFLKQIESKQEQLNTIQPKLETLLEASRPLQEALDMNYEKEAIQRHYASYLPSCLYYFYIQALAYKEVLDRNLCLNIEGDVDRVKKVLEDKRNEALLNNEDDGDSDDSESEGENKKHEGQHHSQKEGHQRRQTITESGVEETLEILEPFPLQVEIKTSYKGKATIYLKFFYIDYLGVIGVKSRLELMVDTPRAVATANDLLSDETMLAWLFPNDVGVTCPNPAGNVKLSYSKIDLKSKIDITGRLYRWAQQMGGLNFPSKNDESSEGPNGCTDLVFKDSTEDATDGETSTANGEHSSEDSCRYFQSVLQRIQRRVISRLVLQEQFAIFESLNVYPPKEVSSWFPSKIHSKMTKWLSITYDDFICHPASEGFRKSLKDEGWFCSATVERGSAKLCALVYVPVEYPRTAPLFCLFLHWKGNSYTVEKCADLWHLSRHVNVECVRRLPTKIIDHILSVQLQFLISRLDVLLEVQSLEQGSGEFPPEHLFQDLRKSRDRRLPFWFNERRNCYTFGD